ncbi:MutS-related protein [Gabonibacter massiliensis]|uniref:MutS-related protein n=1 Tax=Gabonibacter massiliensis TaxID=1720195 RepID=UPI00073F9E29|nr:DNA mismatch repair protein [Gabonibacter massiliensis]
MSFTIDKQTLDDLNIFGKQHRGNSIYSLFNTTRTRGGALVLEEMFLYPLSDVDKINKRSTIIKYFQEKNVEFPFRSELFDTVEHYLSNTDSRTKIVAENNTLQRKFRSYMGTDTEYELLHKGILASVEIINCLHDFFIQIDAINAVDSYKEEVEEMNKIILDEEFAWAYKEKGLKKIAYAKTADYDHILRYAARDKMKKLLYYIYNMDVYISIAQVAIKRGFVFAKALPSDQNVLKIDGMYHPQLKNPTPNTLHVDHNSNVIFLTGANMAGKSTFMKTFGVCIFLAHMGFPIPAESMEFSVQNGMYTTINLPDNLNMGYSHFYAEVLRVKKVAESVSRSQNLIVVFDELFRGTNVKDAYDATVAVTEAFAANRNCTFIISTHIIEAGETLRGLCDNINFAYLPTIMQGSMPVYTYKLASGITNDRHGMMIINNERIIEIIKSRKKTNNAKSN